MSPNEHVRQHLRWCELRNLRPSTVTQRRYALRRLERVIGEAIADTDAATLSQWYDRLDLTAQARGTELAHVRQFYKWLQLTKYRPDDPTVELVRPRAHRSLPRPMSDDDLAFAVQTAPARVRPWLYLAALAGLRACEIAALEREDIVEDHEPPVLIVRAGKGGHARVVPLHPVLAEVLRDPELPRKGSMFRRERGRGPLPPYRVSQVTNKHLHDIGLDVTLHQARHYFGTTVYRASQDLRLTQDLLGHASPISTAGYAAWSPSKGAEVVQSMRDPSERPPAQLRNTARER